MEYYEKSRDCLPIKSQILVLFLLEFQISTAGPINNLYNAEKKEKIITIKSVTRICNFS